ncbi:uncharacterized protein H6S33_006064 [Morchella sextelata]|uniref:uncharacterized protein n=1 Tax=Morchella sextelata TaxID=1174677 RepID=UPI001D03AC78|nr:uncharacterized protein H6S33_006064 [Morchella sextelata]KAH0614178.1 hypothetical protein H6S33_006064 [Morchella sextelata]
MRFSIASILAASPVLLSSLVSAQTYSECNPMLRRDCPADPALSGTYAHIYGGEASSFKYLAGKDMVKYGSSDGAHFRVEKSKDSPTIVSNFYIMWGKFEVTMKAAPGAGIVSSIVLQSDDLDEIDWEWLGGKPDEAQSNYFGKGNTATYDRGAFHTVDSQATFHKYGLNWTAEKLEWLIDDVVVRTLTPAMVKGDYYPQTPMTARIGIWSGGDSDNEPGVIAWSGGPTNYKEGPFDMIVKKIYVQDYSSGKEYRYTDQSGSADSIEAVGGEIGAGPQSGAGNAATATGSPSAYNAPSNSGRLPSSTSKSEATSGASGNNADSSESTHNSASPSSSSSSSAGANGAAYIATGGSSSGSSETYTGAASSTMAVKTAGLALAAAGLIVGWIL